MNCPKCGAKNHEIEMFCKSCGHDLQLSKAKSSNLLENFPKKEMEPIPVESSPTQIDREVDIPLPKVAPQPPEKEADIIRPTKIELDE